MSDGQIFLFSARFSIRQIADKNTAKKLAQPKNFRFRKAQKKRQKRVVYSLLDALQVEIAF